MAENLYAKLAAAYVRGEALCARENGGVIRSVDADISGKRLLLPDKILDAPLDALVDAEIDFCLAAGREAGLKLYRFKNSHDVLPRVKIVLGFLRGISFHSLLDVGSGRGVFLWPFMSAFPEVEVLSMDLLEGRADFLRKVRLGGMEKLTALQGDLCACDVPDKSRDVVALLEVLEHIPDTEAALRAALRIARRYVVISVPNKPDDNPEHIHLFTKDSLTALFRSLGATRLRFDAVNGHLLLFASL